MFDNVSMNGFSSARTDCEWRFSKRANQALIWKRKRNWKQVQIMVPEARRTLGTIWLVTRPVTVLSSHSLECPLSDGNQARARGEDHWSSKGIHRVRPLETDDELGRGRETIERGGGWLRGSGPKWIAWTFRQLLYLAAESQKNASKIDSIIEQSLLHLTLARYLVRAYFPSITHWDRSLEPNPE